MSDITDQDIIDAAKSPQSVTVDGMSLTNKPASELIQAREDVETNRNAISPRRGLLLTRMIPGSAVGQ